MLARPHLPVSFTVLAAHSTAKLFERAQQLCREAEITRERAALSVADCKRQRLERRQWKAIWSALRARPDHFAACCAYCTRFRTPSGEWVAIPAGVNQILHHFPALNVSHGICPDCLSRQQPNH